MQELVLRSTAGMISLGGGLPSSEYFPFEHIDIKVPEPPRFSEQDTKVFGRTITAGKHDIAEGKSLYGAPSLSPGSFNSAEAF